MKSEHIDGVPTEEGFAKMLEAFRAQEERERELERDGAGRKEGTSLRECDCGSEENKLDVAHVTYGTWAVLCVKCGALGDYSSTEQGCIDNWNNNKLVRPVGYFFDPKREEEATELAREIARNAMLL